MSSLIPAATSAAGQNNNTGGKGALNSPWNGSGMDLNNASRILDPLGLSGNGGLNKSAIEAFLDPAGIDSTSSGLNLFGNRPSPDANGAGSIPSVLPNLGAQSLIPQMPQGGFMPLGQTNPMGGNGGGIFNQMAAQSAGQLFNPGMPQTPASNYQPGMMLPTGSPSWQQQMTGNMNNIQMKPGMMGQKGANTIAGRGYLPQ